MDISTQLGSRLAQLGLANEIDRIERAHGRRIAQRRATEALIARAVVRREYVVR